MLLKVLDEVAELLRVVKPKEAQDRMAQLISSFTADELRTSEESLRDAINRFHKKRRRALLEILESKLSSIKLKDQLELDLAKLAVNAEGLRAGATQSNAAQILELVAAITRLREFAGHLARQCPAAESRIKDLAEPAIKTAEDRILEHFRHQVNAAVDSVHALGRDEIQLAFEVLGSLRQVKTNLLNALSGLKHEIDAEFVRVSCSTAVCLVEADVEPEVAWRPEAMEILRQHVVDVMALTSAVDSRALAVAVLLFENVYQEARKYTFAGGVVKLASDIRAYAENRTQVADTTAFEQLAPNDLELAVQYSGRPIVRSAFDGLTNKTLQNLSRQLKDDRAFRTFLVEGIQPRIAELAFSTHFSTLTGLADAQLQDENLVALQNHGSLPRDDFTCAGRQFDVKCNLYFSSHAGQRGLRGFQVNLTHRDPRSELAAFVFTNAGINHATWTFVGFAVEGEIPEGQERASPFQFSMPDHMNF